MSATPFPQVTLVRHAETTWSASGIHTGHIDVALTQSGERSCRALGQHLRSRPFSAVWSSPTQRAMHTYALSGFDMEKVALREDLEEWDYGSYEGLTTEQIHVQRPGWRLFRDGCPDGESVTDVGNRADAVIKELREADNIAVFSSGHFLRVLAARWLGLAPGHGADFALGTASISVLGYEHSLEEPVIRSWNQQFADE